MNNAELPQKRYTDELYFGVKPQNAIITNTQNLDNVNNKSLLDYEDKPKRLYVVDDGNKRNDRKSDTYFVKTYNEARNNFSSCLVAKNDGNGNGFIQTTSNCDKTNPESYLEN